MRPRRGQRVSLRLLGRSLHAAAYHGLMDSYWTAVAWSLLPTVVVLGLFVFVLRAIIRMDRSERRVYARIENEERAKRGLPPVGAADTAGPDAPRAT